MESMKENNIRVLDKEPKVINFRFLCYNAVSHVLFYLLLILD